MEAFNIVSRDQDNILDQIYVKQTCPDFYYDDSLFSKHYTKIIILKKTFFVLKEPEKDLDKNKFSVHNFLTKRSIFLGKYFKKSVKDCKFSVRQLKTMH